MNITSLQRNREGAATELGYVFTFLLGVLLLTMFSLWIYDIESATRERWNQEAIDANMNDLSAAIERTDVASRIDNSSYAERVYWRTTEADESQFTLELTDTTLVLYDDEGELDTDVRFLVLHQPHIWALLNLLAFNPYGLYITMVSFRSNLTDRCSNDP